VRTNPRKEKRERETGIEDSKHHGKFTKKKCRKTNSGGKRQKKAKDHFGEGGVLRSKRGKRRSGHKHKNRTKERNLDVRETSVVTKGICQFNSGGEPE